MKNLTTISTDLFHKIRSSFTDIKIGDEEGKVTTTPSEARFFDVNYSIQGNDLGRVNIKLDDDSLTVIYNESMLDGQDALKSDWFEFLRNMRQFAKRNMLRFDTRDITKSNLDQRDYQYLAQKTGENKMSESKLFGTSKTSYQDIGTAKIIVKHSAPVNYDNPAGRSQRIESIYVESEAGERFRYPHKHLNGARAMAMHISNGGNAYDGIGSYISGLSEELSKLKQFKNYSSRSGVMSETLDDLNQRVLDRMDAIKQEIHGLQRDSVYQDFASKFQPQETAAVPDDIRNNWVEALTIKSFNEELTDVFPYLYKLVNEQPKEITYDDIVSEDQDVCDDCGKDPCECDDVKEDSMFSEFEQGMDEITTFEYDMPEGRMSDIDIDLRSLANRGDEEDLIAALDGDLGPGAAAVLKDMMEELKDELAAKGMNDVMRDEDKMIEILWDKLVDEYGGDDEYNDDGGETDDNYALASAGFGSDEDYESANNEAYNGKYKDLDNKTGDRLTDWLQEWIDYLNDSDDFGLASDVIGLLDKFYDGDIGFREVQAFVFNIADEPTSPLRRDFIKNFAPNKIQKTQPDLFDDGEKEKDRDEPPFDADPEDKPPSAKAGKYGRGPSTAKHLAKQGMKSVMPKEVVEFISSLYDRETGTFPKGEEGVKIAVEKKFGEQAGRFAGFVVEKLSGKLQSTPMVDSTSVELDRVRELAGMQQEGDIDINRHPQTKDYGPGPNPELSDKVAKLLKSFEQDAALHHYAYGDPDLEKIVALIAKGDPGSAADEVYYAYRDKYGGEVHSIDRIVNDLENEFKELADMFGESSSPELEDLRRLSGM